MAILLRLAKKTVWSGGPNKETEREALESFQRRPDDEDGTSVFEVESLDDTDPSYQRVIASIACTRENDDPIDLLPVPLALAQEFGDVTPTCGDSPLASANDQHRSLAWSPEELEGLARRLLDSETAAFRVPRDKVRGMVAQLSPDDVDEQARPFVAKMKEKHAAKR